MVNGSLLGFTVNHTSNGKTFSTTNMPRLVGFNDDVEEYRIFNIPQTEEYSCRIIVSPERFKFVEKING